ARDGHPNAQRLAQRLAKLEGGGWAVMGGSGMASISAAVLVLVGQGERIVASNRLYGRTTQLFTQELARFGVQTTLVDCTDLAGREDDADLRQQVLQVTSIWGLSSPPFDCWLAERSLDTLGLRMKAASANAAALADWLALQPAVAQVVYPGRPEHPDHAAAR